VTALFDTTAGTFPDFEVISELGRGAETVVYRVRRRDREYALKLLTGTGNDARALTSLRREAALLGSVGDPLLPRIFEVGQVEAGPYLIMELIDGRPLAQVLRMTRLDEHHVVRLAIDIVGPLTAAHRAGLVHRDVKPDNIIICPDGTARIIDFGLVFRHGVQQNRLAGTLLYSAPEQTGALRRPVDGRSDLYALGVMLYECVTGHSPYWSDDPAELIRMHATAPVPDPRSIRPGLSATLAAVIGKLMAKDPGDRYQNGESLLADLHRLAGQPGLAFPVGVHPGEPRAADPDRLLGRDQEVVRLANRWLTAREGRGGAAVVEGPPGVGKSRLVREVTNAVSADGDLVLYGKCVPDDPVPLAPLRAAVERYLRTVDRLPDPARERAVERLRRAAGRGGSLLGALSPLLAEVVQAPDLGEKDRHEQFINAVAAFLIGLADEFQGVVLHIDDVQWLDGPTHRVLQQLTSRLPGTPLLVLATSRDDAGNAPGLARFMADMDATLDTRISLAPLPRDAAAHLLVAHLGGVRVADAVLDELVERVGGNPFTVVEYVRAIIDAGLITPSWEEWRLDLAGLDRLDLSGDALDLVLQRIDGLGIDSRHLLAAGAAAGRRFDVDLVSMICEIDPRYGRHALAEAEARRLVTASGPDGYRFPHDRIREALLAELHPGTLHRLHQRIAEILESTGGSDSRYVYAIARHYALGEIGRTPEKVYATGLAAGRLALVEHAPAEARDFLTVAAAAAASAGLTPGPDLHLALGVSCTRTGRFEEALGHLDRALRAEPDPLHRAALFIEIAWVHTSAWDPARAFQAVKRGLDELGRPLPRGGLTLAVTTLASFLFGLLIGGTKIGFGSARGRRRERLRLQAILYDAGAYASTLQMHRKMRAILGFRSLYVINRLGPGAEYIRHMAGFGVMADVAGRPKLAVKIYDRAARVAAGTGDPVLVGHVEWKRGAGRHLGAVDDGQTWMRALIEHERWLELGDYLTGVSSLCIQLVKRGRTHDAQAWYARGRARLAPDAQAEGAAFGTAAAAIAGQLGLPEEAAAGVDTLSRFVARNPGNMPQLINLFAARIMVLVELGNLGEPFERVTAEFAQLAVAPETMVPEQRVYYVYEALGRLTQCHEAGPERRGAYRAAAEQAVERLGKAADNRVLRAFHQVARADLTLLAGDPEAALRDVAHAELELLPLDAPLIAYEAARVRARAMRALDEPGQARTHARCALMLAYDQRWEQRIRWIRSEFGITASTPAWTTGASLGSTVDDPGGLTSWASRSESAQPTVVR
jgi:tetratricopeptide (TPR) repeat protein/predicted Ser/Thr protein kinase